MTCFLAGLFAFCCGVVFAGGGGSFEGTMADPSGAGPGHGLPTWVRVGDTVGPLLIFGAAIVVMVLLFLPPVFRHFHPSPGRPSKAINAGRSNQA